MPLGTVQTPKKINFLHNLHTFRAQEASRTQIWFFARLLWPRKWASGGNVAWSIQTVIEEKREAAGDFGEAVNRRPNQTHHADDERAKLEAEAAAELPYLHGFFFVWNFSLGIFLFYFNQLFGLNFFFFWFKKQKTFLNYLKNFSFYFLVWYSLKI